MLFSPRRFSTSKKGKNDTVEHVPAPDDGGSSEWVDVSLASPSHAGGMRGFSAGVSRAIEL